MIFRGFMVGLFTGILTPFAMILYYSGNVLLSCMCASVVINGLWLMHKSGKLEKRVVNDR